jgi:hypothetical protein
MKILALIILVLWAVLDARAADDKTPAGNLADGRSGVIRFESLTPRGYFQPRARRPRARRSLPAP